MVAMYIERVKSKPKGKTYQQILLRESYREPGAQRSAVKKRTLLNLTNYPTEVVSAIELALKHKGNLSELGSLDDIQLAYGPAVGGVYTIFQIAKRLGLEKALGVDKNGKLALWQVIARVLDQGSRLSAVRLARNMDAPCVIDFERGFCENDLYENLTWIAENQDKIEQRLFKVRRGEVKTDLFLYDVTSSYLEGDQNEFGAYGYNRDGKKGKKQIVIGLLCDSEGEPVSTEVFAGNTTDLSTFESQVRKATDRFGCQRVTFVGDRGMIKNSQISQLSEHSFNYITAITKSQIEKLIKDEVLQLGLFDEKLCEVTQDKVRYILRRNPLRAEEIARNRESKKVTVQTFVERQNEYLANHPRAKAINAWEKVYEKIEQLNIDSWLNIKVDGRKISLEVDEERLTEIARLDGCYVLKTDLPAEVADKELVHKRYKDLAFVETAFRTSKTTHLEVRPLYVRTEANTRAYVLVVMLAYMIVRELRRLWAAFDVTVEEGLELLKGLRTVEIKTKSGASCLRLPNPDPMTGQLLEALKIKLPPAVMKSNIEVDAKKKLDSERI